MEPPEQPDPIRVSFIYAGEPVGKSRVYVLFQVPAVGERVRVDGELFVVQRRSWSVQQSDCSCDDLSCDVEVIPD